MQESIWKHRSTRYWGDLVLNYPCASVLGFSLDAFVIDIMLGLFKRYHQYCKLQILIGILNNHPINFSQPSNNRDSIYKAYLLLTYPIISCCEFLKSDKTIFRELMLVKTNFQKDFLWSICNSCFLCSKGEEKENVDWLMVTEMEKYETGKRWLATMMGEDAETFTDEKISVSMKFLVGCQALPLWLGSEFIHCIPTCCWA